MAVYTETNVHGTTFQVTKTSDNPKWVVVVSSMRGIHTIETPTIQDALEVYQDRVQEELENMVNFLKERYSV